MANAPARTCASCGRPLPGDTAFTIKADGILVARIAFETCDSPSCLLGALESVQPGLDGLRITLEDQQAHDARKRTDGDQQPSGCTT